MQGSVTKCLLVLTTEIYFKNGINNPSRFSILHIMLAFYALLKIKINHDIIYHVAYMIYSKTVVVNTFISYMLKQSSLFTSGNYLLYFE